MSNLILAFLLGVVVCFMVLYYIGKNKNKK